MFRLTTYVAVLVVLICVGLLAATAQAVTTSSVVIETVPVSNVGNAGEQSRLANYSDTTYYGGVDYEYNIGKYEVSSAQYTKFLNAVAGVDTFGVYNPGMWTGYRGCGIERFEGTGTLADPYQYRVASERAHLPVNYVSWGNAARFSNWLHNGSPSGAQNDSTTEDGSYNLNGATDNSALMAITRASYATWVIPTENEWYKAAYYDPRKPGGPNYWDYPTKHDAPGMPDGIDFDGDTTFDAVFDDDYNQSHSNNTNNAGLLSAYGTMGQGGNVWEWNEAVVTGSERGVRGGGWGDLSFYMKASYRGENSPRHGQTLLGFRVARVPEPSTLILLIMAAAGLLAYARRRRKRIW